MSETLTVTNNNLLETLHDFLESDDYLEGKSIEISDELKKLTIKYTGTIYNSSMPIRAMRSFIELQDTIYGIFSLSTLLAYIETCNRHNKVQSVYT